MGSCQCLWRRVKKEPLPLHCGSKPLLNCGLEESWGPTWASLGCGESPWYGWEMLGRAGRCWDMPGDAGTRQAMAGDGLASGRQPAAGSSRPPQGSPLAGAPEMPQQSQRNGVQPGRAQRSPQNGRGGFNSLLQSHVKGFLALGLQKGCPCSSLLLRRHPSPPRFEAFHLRFPGQFRRFIGGTQCGG